MNYTLVLLTVCVAAYFLGSIPTGYLAGRLLKNIDLREHGSKSVGATNAFRTLGAYPAIAVLLVDVLKGVLAVSLATWICAISKANFNVPTTQSETWIVAVAGIVVLVGHARPIWLRFRGGKSVAASLGVMIAISPTVASAALLVFLGVLAVTRIVSVGSIAAAAAAVASAFIFQLPVPFLLLTILGAFM